MSNRSLRARSGPAGAFLIFFFIVCALSTWTARADGGYVAALPENEFKMEINLCQKDGSAFPWVRSKCYVTSFKKRWMDLYNRAIDTLNKDVNLSCDDTHSIFDNTLARVNQELELLSDGEKPLLYKEDRRLMSDYAQTEIATRLTTGRGARDRSCSTTVTQSQSLNLTSNSGTPANPTTAQPTPPVTTFAETRPQERAPANANVHDFSGPRMANANLSSCSIQNKPACDTALMSCLRGCNSAGNVDACNASCQQQLLTCKGCH